MHVCLAFIHLRQEHCGSKCPCHWSCPCPFSVRREGLLGTGSLGWPPQVLHSCWALKYMSVGPCSDLPYKLHYIHTVTELRYVYSATCISFTLSNATFYTMTYCVFLLWPMLCLHYDLHYVYIVTYAVFAPQPMPHLQYNVRYMYTTACAVFNMWPVLCSHCDLCNVYTIQYDIMWPMPLLHSNLSC